MGFRQEQSRKYLYVISFNPMPKPSTKNTYKTLVTKISKEFAEMEVFLKQRIAQGHWNVGRYIAKHFLKHQERAEHGTNFYEKLAKDTGRDVSTLQRSVQFYRTYPIPVPGRELTWGHYRRLMTVKDKGQRKKLEDQILQKKWNTKKVQEYLNAKRELAAPENGDKPIAQLKFTRGRLNIYQIVQANKTLAEKNPLVLDLGFRLQYVLPKNAPRLKENDCVEERSDGTFQKVEASQDELFTYKAEVDRIIDGDTLLASFDFDCEVSISQKLRLRGIDCPEMDSDEGKKAKRFVESRLKDCDFIIVKTYKDRSDKFDRYLADIFYSSGGGADKTEKFDPSLVAGEGKFLNQELLDERLAVPWP